ncbi:hypothetical protein ON05_030975 (plasmid) [Acaryochloris sp. CCMEE 5410]|nr:hypothetical protein ON05_030975 [Acaryochloris sp. CCMEE 5410]
MLHYKILTTTMVAGAVLSPLVVLPALAQTNPSTGPMMTPEKPMTPEQMRQHHQEMMGKMQQMMGQMQQRMAQMTPEEMRQHHQQMMANHQKMMEQMQQMMGQVKQNNAGANREPGMMHNHNYKPGQRMSNPPQGQ